MPAGRSATFVPLALSDVAPAEYGKRISASAFATYSVSPARAMPKGEKRLVRNAVFVSATPSPSPSRRSVMRFALGTDAPAFSKYLAMNHARMPFSFGFGGEFVSATSTSPLGRTYSHRG